MPEEANRIETDELSDLLFAPCEHARDVLVEEGVGGRGPRHRRRPRRRPAGDPRRACPSGGEEGEYVLATAHRNYNTDSAERLGAVLDCLGAAECRVIFPLHPRTRKSIETWDLEVPANVEVRDPVDLHRDAGARARRRRDRHRLRRGPARGLPLGRALRHDARGDRVDRDRLDRLEHAGRRRRGEVPRRPRQAAAADERPPIFGDGHAAERIAELTVAHLDRAREESLV